MKRKILFATETSINQGQGYFPQDIRRLYNIPSDLTGAGQTIGILEFSNGYSINDARIFWSSHKISSPNVTFVSVDGTRNDGGASPDDEEASLDLQWAGAVAPGAKLVVYEASAGQTFATFADAVIATLKYILNDTQLHPTVLSISYGDAESSFDQNALLEMSTLISQLDAKGITVCISSGDQGAYGMHDLRGLPEPHADGPATVPTVVAVGGTSLMPDGSETAWTYNGPENGGATGGGFSNVFTKPAYQSFTSNHGRGLPDVSLNADPATGYQIIFQGQPAVVGGTSVSCPVFAGIVALLNEKRAQLSKPPISGLVATIYKQAESKAFTFKDITVGNNTFNGVTGYQAAAGWDACTGWGALDATAFIDAFVQVDGSRSGSTPGQPDSGGQSGQPGQPGGHPGNPVLPTPHSGHRPVVRVLATIHRVEQDEVSQGAHHHHLLIRDIHVLAIRGATAKTVNPVAYVAIRYGDSEGLPGPIPDLQAGQQIELQGEYVPLNDVYPSIGNPGDPVIHYTHHPMGFVIYQGQTYR